MMRGRFVAVVVGLMAGLTLMAQEAQAQFQLRLEQAGFPSKTITDNGTDDTDPLLGRINYVGAYGTFAVTVNTGLSKPNIGNGVTQADMDLNSSEFSTSTGGTLQITLADTGFAFPNNNAGNQMTLSSSVGGTFAGIVGGAPAGTSVTFRAWANPTNASPLSVDPTVIPPGSVGILPMGPAFTSPYSFNAAPVTFTKGAGPYSIFNQAVINLPGSGRVGFDHFTRVEGQNCTGKLGNYVWNDLNHNGIQESGEPGIPGITVTLMKNGNPSATTTTDASGLYQFTGLCAASYTVEVPPQAGLTGYVASPTLQGGDFATDSNPNPTTVLFVTENEDDQTIDFGYYLPAPHLTLQKSPKGGTFNQGDPISFSFVVGNDGGSAATNVVLNDQLPGNGGLQWMVAPGINPSQGSCTVSATNFLSCNFGTIQKAQTATVTVISTGTGTPMAACQAQPNPIATATADGGLSATDSGSWTCVPPQLSIVKTPDGGTFTLGGMVTFTIVVSNPAPAGASPATHVVLTDTLPNNGGLVWDTATTTQGSCTLTGNSLNCPLGTIAPGGSVTVTVNSTATTPMAACQSQPNPVARATADGGLDVQDSGSVGCSYTASTTLITKTVSPGTTVAVGTPVTITVTETNTGNSTITNVNITGTGCTVWTPASVASLAAGASADFSCTFTPATTAGWSATGHGTDILGKPVSEENETTSGTVTVEQASTTLTTKTVTPSANVIAGTSVTITVTEKNTGTSAITNVNVTGTGCTTWTPASVASLAAGASADFSCTFTANATTNWTATAHGTDAAGNPASETNETTSGTVTVFTASTVLTTKTVSPGTTVISGTPVTITVTEKNTGNSIITNVNVTGTGCTTWTPASVASLAAGASVDFNCTFSPTTTTNWTATGHGKDINNNDVSLDNETTTGTVTVFTASTNLTTKTVSPGTTVIAGTPVTITVNEKNTGNSTITNVNVTGTGCTAWTPASVASLAAGASVDFSCTFTPATTTNWTATGHGKDQLGNDVSLVGETTSGTVTVYTASTSLTTKTVSPSTSVIAGTPVTITVNEKNTGNSTITAVYVTGTGCTTWTPASVASLAAGASVDFSCTFTPTTSTNWSATGHGKDILGKDVSLVGETTSGSITVTPPPPQFCSYTPGGWGAPPNGGNVAALMYAGFSAVYSNTTVVIGNRTQGASIPYSFSGLANYYLKFTSASAITTFLPNGGTPNKLSKSNTNPPPSNGDWGGEFGSQVLALQLNVNFSAAGKVPKPGFATAKVVSGPLAGLTATQVLTLANQALGGNTSVLTPYGITIPQFTSILSSVNGSMDNCTTNTGYMR